MTTSATRPIRRLLASPASSLLLALATATAYADVGSDDFGDSTLSSGWTFDDPNGNDAHNLTARPGWLQLQVNGPDEDVWSTGRGGAPVLRTSLAKETGDFRTETYVDLATSNGGYPVLNCVAGLVVCDSGNDVNEAPFELTLGLQHNWAGGTEVILQKPGHSFKWAAPGANAAYLRLQRDATAGTWTGYYKIHADHQWNLLATVNDKDLPGEGVSGRLEAGLFAKTWDTNVGGPAKVDFAYYGEPDDATIEKPISDSPADVDVATPERVRPAIRPNSQTYAHTAHKPPTRTLKTFCVSDKELNVLDGYREAEILRHSGKGCLTHMWFGGDWPGYERTRIRIYVDGESKPSIDMELGLGHGYGFGDKAAPWGGTKLGKTGHPSGVYNTYKIPFGDGVRVTAQRDSKSPERAPFWWIVRGTENLPLTLAGVRLPPRARLVLHKLENHVAKPYEEFELCNAKSAGALYQVTMAADGQRDSGDWKDISYLEAIVRAYVDGEQAPLQLSSGLEDYFLGTYYFNRGRYANDLAGLTHLDTEDNTFSAYRFHDDDPVFFQKGVRLTCRCGEEIGGTKLHDPPATQFTTYTWMYQW